MIQTKVAQILSPTQVILAAGAEQGVREGMEFIIYEWGHQVLDPETGESLGRLELHKARVKVSQVQERLSVANTLARTVRRPYFPSGFATFTETTYEPLPLDESTATAVAERKLTVRVGDLVRSVD
jgi:hypothetical protein